MRLDYTKVKVLQDAFVSLLNNQFLSDIKFEFADGRIIFAHSFVLCCRSDEFCNSLETSVGVSKLIQVQKATYEEYFEFLKYLYTDSCKIDESILTRVFQLSKKHELPELKTKCVDGVLEDVNVENVCRILGMSIELELENLKIQSTKFIAENYIAALNTESFLKIHDEALKVILELEPVSDNNEFKVFEATVKWAEEACARDGLEANVSLKRQKLGDNLKLLRFGAMTSTEFEACIKLAPDLLTDKEVISIRKYFTAYTFGFADEKRQLILRNSDSVILYDDNIKYDEDDNKKWWINYCRKTSTDFKITFSISQSITIEDIDWSELYGQDISLIKFLENSTIIYEGPDRTGFLNSKKLLHANTRYTLNMIYEKNCDHLYTNADLNFQSKNRKCEFTIYDNFSPIIKYLTFKF